MTHQLLECRPDLGVVLYASDSNADQLYSGVDAGARGYVLKTGSITELVGAIERIAAGGTYLDPRLDRVLLSTVSAQRPLLSTREREIMHLMAEGLTAEAIASGLGVSVETVHTHVRDLILKLRGPKR